MQTIYLILALIFFVITFLPKVRLWKFRKNAEKCEGRIYRVDYVYNNEGGKTVSRITVQFATKSRELITSDLELSGGGFWTYWRTDPF